MSVLHLHDFHQAAGAAFDVIGGQEVVRNFGDSCSEFGHLCRTAGVLDLGCRGRLCLLGTDRERFLNGQVTNDVRALRVGEGCYAAVVSARGRMESDAFVYRLADEFLLDFEPGLTAGLLRRLEHHLIADDVQIVDAAPHFGLLSVQGPAAAAALQRLGLGTTLPERPLDLRIAAAPGGVEVHLVNQPRTGRTGFDLFVPVAGLPVVAPALLEAVRSVGGGAAGWEALETARIEAGIPRYGADMDATTLPPEAGIEERAISYRKGCYIGQEVLARIRTYGRVTRRLCGLRLSEPAGSLPVAGDVVTHDGREVGRVTSAVRSPSLGADIALGYVRREHDRPGTSVRVGGEGRARQATLVPLPFVATGLNPVPPA